MIGFLFKTVKILIIWIVIGIVATYAYGYLKPYFSRAQPIIKQTVISAKNKIKEIQKNKLINNISKKVVAKAKHVKKTIIPKNDTLKNNDHPKSNQVLLADKSSKENKLLLRQMSIVDELMK
ncbi:MAG TPA: hypothetical protein QF753_15070 [Victivallales bacterium]|nr:hypothetical protein [Victivallales bacterium]